MRRAASVFIFLAILPVLGLAAQETWPVDVGQRVRVKTDSGAWIGTLVGQDSAGLQIAWNVSGHPIRGDLLVVTVSRGRVRQLDVSSGRQSNAGKGAGVGFGVGAALGLALGIGCANDSFFHCGGGEVVASTFLIGAIGSGVGALVGSTSTSDRWEPVTSTRPHVTLAPHGVGLALSLPF